VKTAPALTGLWAEAARVIAQAQLRANAVATRKRDDTARPSAASEEVAPDHDGRPGTG